PSAAQLNSTLNTIPAPTSLGFPTSCPTSLHASRLTPSSLSILTPAPSFVSSATPYSRSLKTSGKPDLVRASTCGSILPKVTSSSCKAPSDPASDAISRDLFPMLCSAATAPSALSAPGPGWLASNRKSRNGRSVATTVECISIETSLSIQTAASLATDFRIPQIQTTASFPKQP